MNQNIIITHAVLIGLTPLIPIPVLDDLVKSFFYKRLVRSLASRYKLTLSASEINILAEDRSQGRIKGCVIGTLEYIVKRLIRKLTLVLEWRRAIDIVTHTYYVGYLMDYTFQQNWYTPGDPQQAVRLRSAIETARKSANTNLVKRIVRSSFNQSRTSVVKAVQQVSRSLQNISFRRFRLRSRRQAGEVKDTIAEKMEEESPAVEGVLHGLIARLETYLNAFQKEHKEHFEGLQQRLADSLKTA